MILVEFIFFMPQISRLFHDHLSPVQYFLLLIALSYAPSIFVLMRIKRGMENSNRVVIVSLFLVLSVPVALLEYFTTACHLFNKCHLL